MKKKKVKVAEKVSFWAKIKEFIESSSSSSASAQVQLNAQDNPLVWALRKPGWHNLQGALFQKCSVFSGVPRLHKTYQDLPESIMEDWGELKIEDWGLRTEDWGVLSEESLVSSEFGLPLMHPLREDSFRLAQGLNPCPDGLGHFFREEFSKFKWAFPWFWGVGLL